MWVRPSCWLWVRPSVWKCASLEGVSRIYCNPFVFLCSLYLRLLSLSSRGPWTAPRFSSLSGPFSFFVFLLPFLGGLPTLSSSPSVDSFVSPIIFLISKGSVCSLNGPWTVCAQPVDSLVLWAFHTSQRMLMCVCLFFLAQAVFSQLLFSAAFFWSLPLRASVLIRGCKLPGF